MLVMLIVGGVIFLVNLQITLTPPNILIALLVVVMMELVMIFIMALF